MYPPPQHQPLSVARPDAWKNIVPHLHSHPDAFAYEYIFEDGRLPFLAELHPKNKKDVKTSVTVTIPSHTQLKQNKSRPFEEPPLYRVETTISAAPAMEKTSDKLKRAFSLSGMRSSNNRSATPGPRRQPPQPASLPRTAPLQNAAPRSEAPRVPSLVLPTPSPSPEPSDSSSHRSGKSINFSLPRSSWTSWDYGDDDDETDELDMAFLRDTAHGRLSPGPAPPMEPRRDKALALLGISHMPPTPPYTPAGSRAPSVHDRHYQSRLNSRRASAEQRLSHHSLSRDERPAAAKALPKPPNPDPDRTPRAAPAAKQEPAGSTAAGQDAPPRQMQLKRKTSKFIEHLDEITVAPPAMHLAAPAPLPRRGFSARTPSPRLPPSPSPGLARSQSLRTPEMRPGPWMGGSPGVVCTAEARPIVAVGTARLVGA